VLLEAVQMRSLDERRRRVFGKVRFVARWGRRIDVYWSLIC